VGVDTEVVTPRRGTMFIKYVDSGRAHFDEAVPSPE